MRMFIRAAALGSALVLAGVIASSCRKSAAPSAAAARRPPAVTAAQPIRREVVEWDEYPGRVEPVDMVEIRARVSGYLQSIHFKDGTEVKKGDLLFVIDPRPYQAELDRAEALLNQARTRSELASNDLARAERLLKSKAISEEEADARSKAKREAEAAIQSAAAAVASARLNVEYTHITAPISGRIGRKLITEGNLVNGNQGQSTLLTTIVSVDPIYCYFDPGELAIQKYQHMSRSGQSENLRDGKMVCELGLATEKGFPHRGVLDFVDNRLDPTTGTLRLRGVFENPGPDRVLQPGFFARIRVPGSGKYPALLLPDEAIGTDQSQKFVYVIGTNNVVKYRPVQLGPSINGLRVVRQGVASNDWVVVNGVVSLRPDTPVNPTRTSLPSGTVQPLASAQP